MSKIGIIIAMHGHYWKVNADNETHFLTGYEFAAGVDRSIGKKVRLEYRSGPNYGLWFATENVEI